ncbi:MAG: RsiV family protein [Flammeovirgaceae bacterium]|nr:RsiV family protein [Flammeovirgaceae bacterium]MDW8286961.1 RsiV family protein [Flammeovirgaceae bacterium]
MNAIYQRVLLIFLFLNTAFSCQKQEEKTNEGVPAVSPPPIVEKKLSFTVKEYSKTYGNPDDTKEGYAVIKFQFPQFEGMMADELNKSVQEFLFDTIVETDKKDLTLEDVMNEYIDAFKQTKKEKKFKTKSLSLRYVRERIVSVQEEIPHVITLKLYSYEYEGGANPTINILYRNFLKSTGKRIFLEDLFTEDYQTVLNKEGEKSFRKVRKLTPKQSLKKAGFDFEHNQFTLNDNFALEKDSILFYYNVDEIASPSMGATALKIAYKDLSSILKPNFLTEQP